RLLPDRVARRREGLDIERTHRDAADSRVAVAFPIEVAAAIGAEVEADPVAAVGLALVNLALAFEPHLVLPIARAEMKGGTGAAPAGLAVTEIDALRLAGGDDPQLTAMTLRHPFHWRLRRDRWCRALLPLVCRNAPQ